MAELKKLRFLNSNGLKFLGAFLMVIDHIGMLFFPSQQIWRIIGRLAMPLFAFAVTIIVPVLIDVRPPFSSIVAIFSSSTLHSISLYVAFSGDICALSTILEPLFNFGVPLSVVSISAGKIISILSASIILSVNCLCVAVIVAIPGLFAIASPFSVTEITFLSDDVQTIVLLVVFSG